MQVLALAWGILAVLGLGLAFIPCLGWLNWANIPFSLIGLAISASAYNKSPVTERGMATAGMVLNGAGVVLGAIRLWLGGGII